MVGWLANVRVSSAATANPNEQPSDHDNDVILFDGSLVHRVCLFEQVFEHGTPKKANSFSYDFPVESATEGVPHFKNGDAPSPCWVAWVPQ